LPIVVKAPFLTDVIFNFDKNGELLIPEGFVKAQSQEFSHVSRLRAKKAGSRFCFIPGTNIIYHGSKGVSLGYYMSLQQLMRVDRFLTSSKILVYDKGVNQWISYWSIPKFELLKSNGIFDVKFQRQIKFYKANTGTLTINSLIHEETKIMFRRCGIKFGDEIINKTFSKLFSKDSLTQASITLYNFDFPLTGPRGKKIVSFPAGV